MQIELTLARLVRLNFGLSRYFGLSESLSQKVKSPIEFAELDCWAETNADL